MAVYEAALGRVGQKRDGGRDVAGRGEACHRHTARNVVVAVEPAGLRRSPPIGGRSALGWRDMRNARIIHQNAGLPEAFANARTSAVRRPIPCAAPVTISTFITGNRSIPESGQAVAPLT